MCPVVSQFKEQGSRCQSALLSTRHTLPEKQVTERSALSKNANITRLPFY